MDPGAGRCAPAAGRKASRPASRRACLWFPRLPPTWRFPFPRRLRPRDSSGWSLTVLQPVSERGPEAIEELESQVVKLLSFQPVSQTVFDAQVGFNMLSSYGPESGEKLADARARIADESRRYLAGRAPVPAIMLVQAPVFYSHAFTAYAEFKAAPALGRSGGPLARRGIESGASEG